MSPDHRPEWQLPPGVTRGLWDYADNEVVADDYDNYFAHNKLFDLDEQLIARHFRVGTNGNCKLVVDLGCGTGRALLPLIRRGFRGLAIDLSERMLRVVRTKAEQDGLSVNCLQANLTQLDGVVDCAADYAMCMFSTLGMIHGKNNRQQALNHISRILKPDGVFVLHVHNYWYNLYDPGGPWWLLKNFVLSAFDRDMERGDKYFHYRGVANMFLHVFTRSEISRDLRLAGLQISDVTLIDRSRMRPLQLPWILGRLRANGWIFVCRKERG